MTIGFPPEQALARDVLHQDHRDFLEELAASILGRKVSLRFQVRDGIAVAPPAPPEAPRDPMTEFRNDPLIRKALEIFGAEIQPA